MEQINKTIDVIIPAYRPGKEFPLLLQRLKKQNQEIQKVVIMNTEEKFWNKEWENQYPSLEVHHLKKSEFDHGGTRKKAAEYSTADFMVFMTQDALPADENMIGNLIRPLYENEKTGAAYARQLPRDDCSFIERYTRSFNYPEKSELHTKEDISRRGVKAFFCSNVCAAYKKDLYLKLGGFVDRTIFNEDMIYAGNLIKRGYQVAYAADARVIHSHNYSCMQQFHRNFDLGVSQAEHPEIFEGVSSEGEGIRLVKKTLAYLLKSGKIWLIPGFFLQSGFKYAGYFMGKRYRKLPRNIVLKCTMNRTYWNQFFF